MNCGGCQEELSLGLQICALSQLSVFILSCFCGKVLNVCDYFVCVCVGVCVRCGRIICANSIKYENC